MEAVIFDARAYFGDVIITLYDTESELLYVMYSGFSVLDEGSLRFRLRDRFVDVQQVHFIKQRREGLKTVLAGPQIKHLLNQPGKLLAGWDCDRGWVILDNLNDLCSPYPINQALKAGAKPSPNIHHLDLKWVNEKAVTMRCRSRVHQTLQQQVAYAGLTLFDTPAPEFDDEGLLTANSLVEQIAFQATRTMTIARLFETPLYQTIVSAKQSVIERYLVPLTAAASSANIAASVITSNGGEQLVDEPTIDLSLPIDGKKVNVLDRLDQQGLLPASVVKFYGTMQGRSLQSNQEVKQLRNDLPGHETALTVPYYDQQGQPVNAFATLSLGGAHGSASQQPIPLVFDDTSADAFTIGTNVDKARCDERIVYSIDADSFYPTLAVKVGLFGDRYADIRAHRLAIKKSLPANEATWTAEDRKRAAEAKADKLLINAPTGKANTHNKRALLPLDNRMTSLRLIGNLLIYELGSRFTQELGARVIFTNTDGIKVSFNHLKQAPTREQVEALAEQVGKPYGVHYVVKQRSRALVKDTNAVMEWQDGKLASVSGSLGRGYQGRMPLTGNMNHPPIVDMAVTAFLTAQPEQAPKQWLANYLENRQANKLFKPLQWCLVIKPSPTSKLFLGDDEVKGVARVWLDPAGQPVYNLTKAGQHRKMSGWPIQTATPQRNLNRSLRIDRPEIAPYLQWCLTSLAQWTPITDTQVELLTNTPVKPLKKTHKKPVEKPKPTHHPVAAKKHDSVLAAYTAMLAKNK